MNILYFDLENTPILGYVWRAYEDSILHIKKDFGLICFAYAINDEPVSVVSIRGNSEKRIVKKLWDLFNYADVIVAHNGDKFDIRVANALFLRYGLKPPSPYRTVDTLKLAKKHFRLSKYNLDSLSNSLLGESKHSTDITLWLGCIDGDVDSLKRMEEYCAQDTILLRKIYKKIRMWHTGHPNSNLYLGTQHRCPVCNGDTQKRGTLMTRVGIYQRYQCKSCGGWSKGTRMNKDKVLS